MEITADYMEITSESYTIKESEAKQIWQEALKRAKHGKES